MITAFTKDWNDVPTCTTHILREMATSIPVLWIESIGTRKPDLTVGGKDMGRIIKRLKRAFAGPDRKENHLWVLAPLLIPKATTDLQIRMNRILFRLQERAAQRKMAASDPPTSDLRPPTYEYWCFVPNAIDLLPKEKDETGQLSRPEGDGLPEGQQRSGNAETENIPQAKVVYYCVDDWTQFHNLDGDYLGQKERELVARATVIFAASRYLVRKIEQLAASLPQLSAFSSQPSGRPKVVYMPHGVEHAKFAAALAPQTVIPADIATIPHPIIGFYGNLHSWVDVDLIATVARNQKMWHFVLIGHPYDDMSPVESLPNVHLLGRKEHDELPAYCKAFDMGIIPYDMSGPRMESVNPVKTKEILAAGLPIVASAIPELEGMEPDVLIARSTEQWIDGIETQLARQDRRNISEGVRSGEWVEKAAEIRRIVDQQEE